MRKRNTLLKNLLGLAVAAGALFGAGAAQAGIAGGVVTPTITAGALPDTPAAHVDPNTSTSAFSGVVSLYIRYGGEGYICSGALIGKRQVLSAGHCIDSDGNGSVVDLNNPANSVQVVFNSDGAYNAIIDAAQVSMHPDYQGFGNCPNGGKGCVNDDLAVVTLKEDAPDSARIYKVATVPVTTGTQIIMAGYGTAGDGVNGHTIDPAFDVKRTGQNVMDLFDLDDEGRTGNQEVYYADFDGAGKDTFCTYFQACSAILANGVEAGIGGGDSGGPSFIEMYGELMLIANNTFEGQLFQDDIAGAFGTYFGGIILGSYADYLREATGGNVTFVPEPGSLALLALGGAMLGGLRRRRKQ